MIHDAIADLSSEKLSRCPRLNKEDRIVIGYDVFERVRIGQPESFGHFQFVAVLVTGRIESRPIVNADGLDDERVPFPMPD